MIEIVSNAEQIKIKKSLNGNKKVNKKYSKIERLFLSLLELNPKIYIFWLIISISFLILNSIFIRFLGFDYQFLGITLTVFLCLLIFISIILKSIISDHQTKNIKTFDYFFTLITSIIIISLFVKIVFKYPILLGPDWSVAVVDGQSMYPTLKEGWQLELMSCRSNDCKKNIERGDIVISNNPENLLAFVKRIVGLPNETISITSGNVYINGNFLFEQYINPGSSTLIDNNILNCNSYKIGADEYFLMGDNRYSSSDSRLFGPVKLKDILSYAKFNKYNAGLEPPKTINQTIPINNCKVWQKDESLKKVLKNYFEYSKKQFEENK